MLNRVAHDEALVDLAKSKVAKYLVNSRVDSIDKNIIKLRDGREFNAKIIVGLVDIMIH